MAPEASGAAPSWQVPRRLRMKLTVSLAQIEVANSQPEMNLSKGQL